MKSFTRQLVRHGYLAGLGILPITAAVRLEYRIAHGEWPDLSRPERFNEWLARRKINWRDKRFISLSDKVSFKEYVRSSLGADWVIPTLWVGSDPRMIPSIDYPYIVKPNNSSGRAIVIRNESDAECSIEEIQRWRRQRNRSVVTERWYRRITEKLLVEPFLSEDGSPPVDYKYFCFGGKVICIQVDLNRWDEHRQAFFDVNWQRLSIKYKCYATVDKDIPCPPYFEEAKQAVEKISAEFDFARVDLYAGAFGTKIGELTFCPQSGIVPFDTVEMDLWLGSKWGVVNSERN